MRNQGRLWLSKVKTGRHEGKRVELTLRTLIFCVLIFFWAAVCPAKLLSDESVIDNVSVSRESGNLVITIQLNFPMRYASNIPVNEGEEVLVRLVPVSTATAANIVKSNRESRTVPFKNLRVQYTGSNFGGPHLQVSFPKSFRFKVRQGKDYRSIDVIMLKDTVGLERKTYDLSLDEAQEILILAYEKESVGELGRAIQLYAKLIERAIDPEIREEAQEHIADARFENGQYAHARAEYRRYLALYPDGKNREEVQRKLDVILEGREDSGLHPSGSGETWNHRFYGEISQFLEQEGFKFEDEGFGHDISLLTTDVNVQYVVEGSRYEFNTVIDSGYELSLNDEWEDRVRASSLYIEGESKNGQMRGMIGRRYGNRGGVYGRFDGAGLSIPLGVGYTLNLISGFPVCSSYDEIDTDTIFYGASMDVLFWGDRLELNAFSLYQEADGLTDRIGIGAETRFTDQMKTVFFLVDYDVYHGELGLALLTANFNIGKDTILSVSTEYRLNPFLTTSNALIGQYADDLDQLLLQYDEDELEQLAKDRTAESTSAHLGIYHIISDEFQLGFDVAWSKLGETETSGGVEGYEGTDDEFYYLLQMTRIGLFFVDDIWTARFKYGDTTDYYDYSPQIYSRFRIWDTLLLVSELDLKYNEHKKHDLQKFEIGPEVRIEYRLTDHVTLEVEAGYWWTFRHGENNDQSDEYYLYLGYYWSL